MEIQGSPFGLVVSVYLQSWGFFPGWFSVFTTLGECKTMFRSKFYVRKQPNDFTTWYKMRRSLIVNGVIGTPINDRKNMLFFFTPMEYMGPYLFFKGPSCSALEFHQFRKTVQEKNFLLAEQHEATPVVAIPDPPHVMGGIECHLCLRGIKQAIFRVICHMIMRCLAG